MSESRIQNRMIYTTDSVPQKDLHIYYLKGRLPREATDSADHFLGNWEEDGYSFLFFSKPADPFIEKQIAILPDIQFLDKYTMTYEEWHGDKITTFRVNRFIIVPPWEKKQQNRKSTNDLEIILDPGLVFGTGNHPTTNDCLEALITLWYDEKIESILDLGTGTGLLAIAAAKLGCSKALAVDFNYLAAKTAFNNVCLNRLEEKIIVVQGRAEELMDKPLDLMISNIHYDVMKNLIKTAAFLKFRYFILSGLLRSEARMIADQLKRLPVKMIKTWDRDGVWHTFLGTTINF
jgi:ribosomal protein L11 methyltransferase